MQGELHLQRCGVAAAAGVAVEEVAHATHAADAAGRAVELLLGGVVLEEAALEAGVGPKLHTAADAGLSDGLPQIAQRADHLPHPRPVQLVPLARVLRCTSDPTHKHDTHHRPHPRPVQLVQLT